MKLWKFYAYLGAGLVCMAALSYGLVALLWTSSDIGYAEIAALVFTVASAHSLLYSWWQLVKHPNRLAVFRKS